jgi:hypothetical protein
MSCIAKWSGLICLEMATHSESTGYDRTTKATTYSASSTISFLIIAVICVLAPGCNNGETKVDDGETTWSTEARSPDGLWLATAASRSEGGGPTAYDFTIVTLKFLKRSDPPTEILGFTQQSPAMNLRMEWVTPKHLHVTYGPRDASDHVSLDFQVVKMSGVEISVRDLSVETKSP